MKRLLTVFLIIMAISVTIQPALTQTNKAPGEPIYVAIYGDEFTRVLLQSMLDEMGGIEIVNRLYIDDVKKEVDFATNSDYFKDKDIKGNWETADIVIQIDYVNAYPIENTYSQWNIDPDQYTNRWIPYDVRKWIPNTDFKFYDRQTTYRAEVNYSLTDVISNVSLENEYSEGMASVYWDDDYYYVGGVRFKKGGYSYTNGCYREAVKAAFYPILTHVRNAIATNYNTGGYNNNPYQSTQYQTYPPPQQTYTPPSTTYNPNTIPLITVDNTSFQSQPLVQYNPPTQPVAPSPTTYYFSQIPTINLSSLNSGDQVIVDTIGNLQVSNFSSLTVNSDRWSSPYTAPNQDTINLKIKKTTDYKEEIMTFVINGLEKKIKIIYP